MLCVPQCCFTGGGQVAAACDGWVGHTLDPIGCLYTTLTRASIVPEETAPSAPPAINMGQCITETSSSVRHKSGQHWSVWLHLGH